MKFTLFMITTCLIYCAHCMNETRLSEPINNQQIAEFYNTVLNLIEIAQSEADSFDYSVYFDETLERETTHILARLRAYAYNQTQADEWENIAIRIFRIYVVRWCMSQARAYYEALVAVCTPPDNPPTLLAQCIRQLSRCVFQEMQENFEMPYIENPILLHELNRLARMQVRVFNLNIFPYLRLHLASRSYERFIEVPLSYQTINNSFNFDELTPYSPYVNYMKELTTLRNAQSHVNMYWFEVSLIYNSEHNSTFLKDCVDESLHHLAREFVRGLVHNIINFNPPLHAPYVVDRIMIVAFLNILTSFLNEEYHLLVNHPAYYIYSPNNETMIHLMSDVNRLDHNIMETAGEVICRMQTLLRSYRISNTPIMLQDYLDCHGYRVGYSCGTGCVAVINNDQLRHGNITMENETVP